MKADQDDIPEHIRNRKKEGPWWFVGMLVVGSTTLWGLVTLFTMPVVFDANLNKDPAHITKTSRQHQDPERPAHPVQASRPATPTPIKVTAQRELSKAEIEWFEQASKNAEKRIQNSFNDQNYQPRGADNTIPPPPQYASASQPSTRTTRRSVEHAGEWIDKWSGGARYYAKWKVINNYIDNGSVCENHGRGSIDYRECRKGAKQYFRDECKNWSDRWNRDREDRSDRLKTRFCSAASTFNPMG